MKNRKQHFAKKYGAAVDRDFANLILPVQYHPMYLSFYPIPGYILENNWESTVYVLTVGGEARGEQKEGIQAVAEVIANRHWQQKDYFGRTLRDVCIKNDGKVWQFDCWRRSNPNRKWMEKPDGFTLRKIVDVCLPYFDRTTTIFHDRRVCYYHHQDVQFGEWAGRLDPVGQIGKHIFYLDPHLST